MRQSCQKKGERKGKEKSAKCESTTLFMWQFWGAPTALSLWLLFAYYSCDPSPTYLRIVYLYLCLYPYVQRELFIWAMRYCACAHSRRLASVSRRVPPSALIYLALGLSRTIPAIRTHAYTHLHTLICIISKDAEQNCGRHARWTGSAKNILKSHSPRRQADAFSKILICICIWLKLTSAWHVNSLPASKKTPRQRCNLRVACLLNQSSYLLLQNKFVLELKHTSSYSFMIISPWLTVANVVQRATCNVIWVLIYKNTFSSSRARSLSFVLYSDLGRKFSSPSSSASAMLLLAVSFIRIVSYLVYESGTCT